VARRLKANLSPKPAGDDRTTAKRVWPANADLGIGNTFYVGLMQTNETEPEQKDWAAAMRIVFPSSPDFGTHVNVSGVLMAKHAPNVANALAMIEFLASDEGQSLMADGNFEYPVNSALKPSKVVAAWGTFTPDKLNVAATQISGSAASSWPRLTSTTESRESNCLDEFLAARRFYLSLTFPRRAVGRTVNGSVREKDPLARRASDRRARTPADQARSGFASSPLVGCAR